MYVVLLLCLGWTLGPSAAATDGPKGPDKPPPKTPLLATQPETFGELLPPRIEDKLDLDPDQKEQVGSLRREFKDKCTDVRDTTKTEVEKINAEAKKTG